MKSNLKRIETTVGVISWSQLLYDTALFLQARS